MSVKTTKAEVALTHTVTREFHGQEITVDILVGSAHGGVSFWLRLPGNVGVPLVRRHDSDFDSEPAYCYFTHVDEHLRYNELRIYQNGAVATLNH